MKHKSPSSIVLLQISLFALGVTGVKAANFTFDSNTSTTGAQDGNGTWNTANVNWWNGTADVAWGAANVAVFGGGTDGTYAVTLGNATTAQALTFNNSGYTLSAVSAQTLSLTNVGNGVISVASNKSVTIGSNLRIAFNAASNTGTRVDLTTGGTLNIVSGGTVSRTGQVTTGFTTTGGTLGFMGSGTINVAGTLSYAVGTPVATGGIVLASNAGNSNTLNVNGGTVSSNSTINGIALVASGTSGTLNVNSGTVSTTGTAAVTSGINLANGTGTTGTVNLNGGTISTFQINSNYYNGSNVLTTGGTSNFNFNGGTLKAIANNASFMGGLTAATVKTGGAVVDSNGFNVTIAQALLHDSTLGATLDGGLVKNGNGTLTLTGASTFTGNTSVNSGTLLVNGSLASAASVSSNATLGGTGSIAGAVTSAGNVNPGSVGTAGTLSLSNGLTLTGGTIALDLNGTNNATGGGTNDLIAITGNLALSGTVLVSPTFTGGTPAASTSYTFATYSGALTGGSSFAAGSRAINIDTATSGLVKLVYTGASSASLNWSSTSSGAWDVVSSLNWLNNGSSTTDRFYQNDTVTFDDTAGLQTLIVMNTTVLPGTVDVITDGNSYTFSGSGGIGGTSSLNKYGSTTLTLSTSNTYTGTTLVDGGTLQLNGSLGGTAITVTDLATFNESATGSISGAASLNITGTATLAGTNTFTGNVSVKNSGTLSVSSPAALGGAGNSLTLLNGGTLITTNTGLFTNGARPITIGVGAASTININSTGSGGSGQFFINTNNTLLGNGSLIVTGSGTLGSSGAGNLRVGSTNTFNGVISLESGGSFEFGVVGAVASSTRVFLGNEGEIISNNNTVPLNVTVTGGTNSVLSFANGNAGNFSGGVTLNANGTVALRDWYNPGVVRSGTISGVVSGSGGLIVNSGTGTGGTLTLGGVNTFTGDITANASSNVTIGAGGRLGSGSYAGNIAMNGGTFTYGGSSSQTLSGIISGSGGVYASGSGTLSLSGANTFTGKTTINAGGVLSVSSLNSVSGGSSRSSLGAPTTVSNGTLDMTGVGGNGTLIYTGSGETTDRVINLAAGATAGLSAVIDQSGSGNLKFTSNLTATGLQTHTLVLKGSTSGTGEIAGAIVDNSGTNKTSVIKEGTGTWTISSNNTYTGATSVTAGKLVVNGNTSTSITTVSGTGTLGGAGTVGALTVQTGGTIAPGSSIESLGAGNVSLESGSTFAYELDSQSLDGDLLYSSGALAISSGAVLTLNELATGSLTSGKLTLISYASWNGGLFTYLGNTLDDDSVITLGGNSWVFNYNDVTGGSNFTADQAGATGFVTMTAVPEPGTTLLGLLGTLALLRRRRA